MTKIVWQFGKLSSGLSFGVKKRTIWLALHSLILSEIGVLSRLVLACVQYISFALPLLCLVCIYLLLLFCKMWIVKHLFDLGRVATFCITEGSYPFFGDVPAQSHKDI